MKPLKKPETIKGFIGDHLYLYITEIYQAITELQEGLRELALLEEVKSSSFSAYSMGQPDRAKDAQNDPKQLIDYLEKGEK